MTVRIWRNAAAGAVAVGTLGVGGRRLTLTTVNGTVALLER
jgi:hypothetical protein